MIRGYTEECLLCFCVTLEEPKAKSNLDRAKRRSGLCVWPMSTYGRNKEVSAREKHQEWIALLSRFWQLYLHIWWRRATSELWKPRSTTPGLPQTFWTRSWVVRLATTHESDPTLKVGWSHLTSFPLPHLKPPQTHHLLTTLTMLPSDSAFLSHFFYFFFHFSANTSQFGMIWRHNDWWLLPGYGAATPLIRAINHSTWQ